jgi:hypothetical protein
MQKGIYNHETGEQEIIDLTPEEIAEVEAAALAVAQKQEAKEAAILAKAELLERLGITAEEAKLLLA